MTSVKITTEREKKKIATAKTAIKTAKTKMKLAGKKLKTAQKELVKAKKTRREEHSQGKGRQQRRPKRRLRHKNWQERPQR